MRSLNSRVVRSGAVSPALEGVMRRLLRPHPIAGSGFGVLLLLSAACTDGAPTGPSHRAPAPAPVFDVVSQPDEGYLANTTRIVIDGLVEQSTVTSVGDDALVVTFDQPVMKRTVPYHWLTWGSPPDVESSTPSVLSAAYPNTSLTLTLSQPVAVFGFEVDPNSLSSQEPFQITATFFSAPGGDTQAVTRQVSWGGGARLFAWSDARITKVEIVVTSPNENGAEALGFAIAQLRYRLSPIPPAPGEQVEQLTDIVNGLGLGAGTANSLQVKLASVLAALTAGDVAAACTSLQAFVSEVRAQSGKKIPAGDAAQLIEKATAIMTQLGCS